ncbi:hypothetical protein TWF281_000599 [Arthrobotrys megalospora]
MDRKAQRIETIRTALRDLIYEQHREQVDPKEITNTHRSRAPFQYVFKSDDPKQPKVSIASISQPDYDTIMRLIKARRLRAIRIDDNPDVVGLKQEGDISQQSPTETIEGGIIPSPVESNRQFALNRRSSSALEEATAFRYPIPTTLTKLPPFSAFIADRNVRNALAVSPPTSVPTQIPALPHSRSVDNLAGFGSFSAMAIDGAPDSPGTVCWNQIHKDIQGLRAGVTRWAEGLDDVQARIEELSKLEKEVGKEESRVAYSEIEKLKSENATLKLRVEALENENKNITNERDFWKRLQGRISQSFNDMNDNN